VPRAFWERVPGGADPGLLSPDLSPNPVTYDEKIEALAPIFRKVKGDWEGSLGGGNTGETAVPPGPWSPGPPLQFLSPPSQIRAFHLIFSSLDKFQGFIEKI
jgi:hypothetical protein